MKNLLLAFSLLISAVSFPLSAKEITAINPPFSFGTHSNVVIDKVVLSDTASTLFMTIYHSPKDWIRIATGTYIRVNGQKYLLKSADNIRLDEDTYADSTGKNVFSLQFPPIDKNTTQLDFIETDCDNCFKIWGVELKSTTLTNRLEVPQKIKEEAIIKEDGKSLEIPQLKAGNAIVKGQFLGYLPEMKMEVNMYVDNPVTGNQEELGTKLNDDGSFELEVPLVTSMQVLFRTPFYNRYILLSPDKETTIYIDLQQKSRQESKYRVDACTPSKYMYFGGANSEINNQIQDSDMADYMRNIFYNENALNDILGMTAEQYKSYTLKKMDDTIEGLTQKSLTKKAHELAVIDIRFHTIHKLMFAHFELEYAYRKAHNLKYEDKLTGFVPPVFDDNYYSFLKDLPVNNPLSLYSYDFGNMINSCKYIGSKRISFSTVSGKMYQRLIDSGKLSPDEVEVAKRLKNETSDSIISSTPKLSKEKPQSDIEKEQQANFNKKYSQDIDLMMTQKETEQKKSYLAAILGTPQSIMVDLMTAQLYCKKFEEYIPLTETELKEISQLKDPFYFHYISGKNNELLAQIEKNKGKKGYTIYDTPKTEGDQAFNEIIKPFAGKVILVDFWATWCGPCRSAMKQFEATKEKFKGKEVAFVYLTDESSPIETWKNMISGIPGEHFRLSNNQFKELKKKFGARGVPSYLILNKKGEQVYFKVGFEGPSVLESKLNAELITD